jgi:hypothetical protein
MVHETSDIQPVHLCLETLVALLGSKYMTRVPLVRTSVLVLRVASYSLDYAISTEIVTLNTYDLSISDGVDITCESLEPRPAPQAYSGSL